jgi:hypothetical protein
MRLLRALVTAIAACFAAPVWAQDSLRLAPTAASELRSICEADRGRLWGVSLCGSLIVADPTTRAVWAAQPDAQNVLQRAGAGWMGVLPAGAPIANASVEWGGVRWIMVVAPLPADRTDLRVLVAHEAWHRAQDALGLPQRPSDCGHLETEEGRHLLRLEFRALSTALRSRGRAREGAARDALLFRAARLTRFPQAAGNEAALDRNEGLASYTGVRLGAGQDADFYAARTLDSYDSHNAYARAYAYASGPAYGLLLDQARPDWRREIAATAYAPADLLSAELRPDSPSSARLQRAANRYGGAAIAREEAARAAAQRARVAELRARFGGPRLELPLRAMQFEFDPTQVTPVEGLGSVYQTLTLRDVWGEITAASGALIDPSFTRLTVAAPGPDGLSGPGWRLRLAPGYRIAGPGADGALRPEVVPPAQ